LLSTLLPGPDLVEELALVRGLCGRLALVVIGPELWVGAHCTLVVDRKGAIRLLYEVMMPCRPLQCLLVAVFGSIVPASWILDWSTLSGLGGIMHTSTNDDLVGILCGSTYTSIFVNCLPFFFHLSASPLDEDDIHIRWTIVRVDDIHGVHGVQLQLTCTWSFDCIWLTLIEDRLV